MEYVDLTQLIFSEMPVYPGTETPVFKQACTLDEQGFRELEMTLFTHTGTHMDSPAHLFEDGLSLDQLSLDRFIGKGIVVDCSHLKKGERISLNEIEPLTKELTGIDFILFYTGWGRKWKDNEYFEGFPVPSDEVVDKLINLNIKGVGLDAISVDPIDVPQLINHRKLLGNDLIIVENLINLDQLLNRNFTFCCFPLKIEKADGSPVRAVAILG